MVTSDSSDEVLCPDCCHCAKVGKHFLGRNYKYFPKNTPEVFGRNVAKSVDTIYFYFYLLINGQRGLAVEKEGICLQMVGLIIFPKIH